MSSTWSAEEAPPIRLTRGDWLRFGLRAVPLVLYIAIGLLLMGLIRLVERPLCGRRRPVSGYLQQGAGRLFFLVSGIGFRVTGRPMTGPGVFVANHSSWSDIFTLAAAARIFFVAKAEVKGWPGIGPLATLAGTIFIRRDRREAQAQQALFTERLLEGQRLLFFPEGTSTDGRRVLPFKPTLFAAFLAPELRDRIRVQPVTVIYRAPEGADPRFYGWWGDMGFGPHLVKVLGARRQGAVEVIFSDPIAVADLPDRKALARASEAAVRAAMPWDYQISR